MNEFTVVIENIEPNIISLETSYIDNISIVGIEGLGPSSVNIIDGFGYNSVNIEENIISLETRHINNIGVVEIERFGYNIINILSDKSIISVSELPDIPMSKITDNLSVARIDGLDTYLDDYEFDCGTP